MRWQGREGSKNVEDRRGMTAGKVVGGGIGIGAIIMALFALISGENPLLILQQLQEQTQVVEQGQPRERNAQEEELAQFVGVVLKDTEDVWKKLFREQLQREYREPVLVLYSRQVTSACGHAGAASGPFYCPADYKLYIDLSFYDELRTRFKAPGEFAMAYIIGHEVGHHVQRLLGITDQVQRQRQQLSQADYNALSVRLELQADFLAGVWAHHAQRMKNILEDGDIEAALRAAAAVGDDRLQMEARGYVVPETFSHGTSEQRQRWFALGLKTGDLSQGDTFKARTL